MTSHLTARYRCIRGPTHTPFDEWVEGPGDYRVRRYALFFADDAVSAVVAPHRLVVSGGGRPAAMHIGFPASAEHLAGVRRAMAGWLDGLAIAEHTVSDVILAVSEACANSIEHGYRNSGCGAVRLAAERDVDRICITVEDTGSWKSDAVLNRSRGRGLPLMRAVSSHFELGTGPMGTRVSMSFHTPVPPAAPG